LRWQSHRVRCWNIRFSGAAARDLQHVEIEGTAASEKNRLTKFELALRSPGRTEEKTMLKIALHSDSDITAAARRLQTQSYPWAMPCVVNSLFSDIRSESGIGSEK